MPALGFTLMANMVERLVPLKWIEYGVYGDLINIYPPQYSIYLRGTIDVPSFMKLFPLPRSWVGRFLMFKLLAFGSSSTPDTAEI